MKQKSKAEKFIKEYTRSCSNALAGFTDENGREEIAYIKWLTPDQARRVGEIAKEETINKACEWLKEIFEEYECLTDYNPMKDFRKAMEGE